MTFRGVSLDSDKHSLFCRQYGSEHYHPVEALKKFESALIQTQEAESWGEIFPNFRKGLLRPRGTVEAAFQSLLRAMLSPGCRSRRAVSGLLDGYCRWRCFYILGLKVSLPDEPMPLDEFLLILWYCNVDSEVKTDYEIGNNARLVPFAFDHGDFQLMRVLVMYGLAPSPSQQSMDCSLPSICYDIFHRFSSNRSRKPSFLYSDINGVHFKDERTLQGAARIPHVVRCLKAVMFTLYGEKTHGRTYARIQQAYMDTLPDPLVTAEEARQFLLVNSQGGPEKLAEADRWISAFVVLFGEPANEPRRLAHLCKCVVREEIVKNSSVALPTAVRCHLQLPDVIEDFILGCPE